MNELTLIDLDQELPGQRRFISCWLSRSDDLTFIVDPGPPSTAEHLISALETEGVRELDFVLLTHVHLDHGGATQEIVRHWPAARVVSHKRGRAHLADPGRLWQGSLQVLGRAAEVYGEPRPVPAGNLADYGAARAAGIEVIPTPGHAPHHLSFVHGDRLFLGEAAGTYSALGRGEDTAEYYLRPATPPRFFPEVARESLERLLALEPLPAQLLFAHHGRHAGDGRALLTTARDQLGLWLETMRIQADLRGGLPAEDDETGRDGLFAATVDALRAVDKHFARGADLPEDIRVREDQFTRQTLKGMLGHLRPGG